MEVLGEYPDKREYSRLEAGDEYSLFVVEYLNRIGSSDCGLPSARSDATIDDSNWHIDVEAVVDVDVEVNGGNSVDNDELEP